MTQEQIDHRVEKMLDHLESQLFAGTITPKDFASNVADLHRWEKTAMRARHAAEAAVRDARVRSDDLRRPTTI